MPPAAHPRLRGWYTVLLNALAGCSFAAAFPQFTMTVSQLSQATGISEAMLLTGDTVKSCAVVAAMLLSGAICKKLGIRLTFFLGMLGTIIPQLLFPVTSSIPLFFFLKILQGLTSIITPVLLLLIMDWMPPGETGMATAVFNGIFYAGGGLGGTFAGLVIPRLGWAASYWTLALVECAVTALWLLTVKSNPEAHREEAPAGEASGTHGYGLLRTWKPWALALALFPTTFIYQAVTVDLPLFSSFLGYGDADTGTMMTAVTAGILCACFLSGFLSDLAVRKADRNRAAARLWVLGGGILVILAAVTFLLLADLRSFGVFAFAAFLLSFGASWGLGSFYSILPEVYDGGDLSVVTGFCGGIGDSGMPTAPMLVGVLLGLRGLWGAAWGVCAALALVGGCACAILIYHAKKGETT